MEEQPTPTASGWRNWLIIVGVVLIVLAVLYVVNRPADGESVVINTSGSGPAPRVGTPAPDFAVTTLDGRAVRLSELKGKPVWLNIWATWCPPCRAEIPDMVTIYKERHAQGLELIAVSHQEDKQPVQEYAARVGFDVVTIGLDPNGMVGSLYRLAGLPSHYFIDRDGVIRDMSIGTLSRARMEAKLKKIMP